MIIGIRLLIVVIALAIGIVVSIKITKDISDRDVAGVRPKGVVIGVILLLLSIFFAMSIGQIEAGSRGVVLRFGATTGKTLNPGFYMVTPFLNTVAKMDVQVKAFHTPAESASRDLQDVTTTVTLNYSLAPSKVQDVYTTLRQDYLERIVKPAVQESVKASTANFNAEDLIAKRPLVKNTIEDALSDRLLVHGILLDTISITDFKFSRSFSEAIEAKVSAAQKALEAENKLRQIEVEAVQVRTAAEGQAKAAIAAAGGAKQAAILNAEGNAQAISVVADAQARANQIINATLTDRVIQYTLAQKLGPDVKVIILPTGQQFILGPEVLGGK